MDYKLNDILECIKLFSTEGGYVAWDPIYETNAIYTGRVICENDVYKVKYVTDEHLYVKEIAVNKSVIYAETIPIKFCDIDKYFKCNRVERKRKLENLKDVYNK